MKTLSAIVIFLSFLKFAFLQETYLESDTQQNADSSGVPASEDEVVREQRSFLRKKLCKGGGLFGHYKGHQGSYTYGHYHGPSDYEGGYDHGYRGNHGGSYGGGYGGNHGGSYGGGYGGNHGGSYGGYYGGGYGASHGNNYGGNYNSRPSYGGSGYYKPGLSYSIGGYNKSPGYESSHPSSGGYNSGYSSGSHSSGHSGGSSYNPGHSSGGYNSGYSTKPHYSSAAYSEENHKKHEEHSSHGSKLHEKENNSKEHADLYSEKHEKKEHEKSNYAAIFSKISHKGSHSGYSKHTKEDTSSSEEDDEKSIGKLHYKVHGYHKEGHKKEHKSPSIVPMPVLPVVSQPVFYVPQVPTVSVVAYSDSSSLYTYPYGSSYLSGDYSTSACGTSGCYAPAYYPSIIPHHHSHAAHNYLAGSSIYKPSTSSYATYPAYSESYVAPHSTYPAYPAIPTPISPSPVALTYASAVPAYQNSAYSYPYSVPTQHSAPASQSYVPTYTVTSFDVQTITTPYQPVIGSDIKTFAKSGSSMAAAKGPPGYVLSAHASDKEDDDDSSSEEHKVKKLDHQIEGNNYKKDTYES